MRYRAASSSSYSGARRRCGHSRRGRRSPHERIVIRVQGLRSAGYIEGQNALVSGDHRSKRSSIETFNRT